MCKLCDEFSFNFHSAGAPNTSADLRTDKDRPATFSEMVNKQDMITDGLAWKWYNQKGEEWANKDFMAKMFNGQNPNFKFMHAGRTVDFSLAKVQDGEIKDIVRGTFKDLQSILNVKFREVATSGTDTRTIEIIENDGSRYSYTSVSGPDETRKVVLHGNGRGDTIAKLLDTDSVNYAMGTIKHEIGHTLGLAHPGLYDTAGNTRPTHFKALEADLDNSMNTIMSYDTTSGYATEFQEFDLITMLSIYGESKAFEDACKDLFIRGTSEAKTTLELVQIMEGNLLAAFTPEFRAQVVKDLDAYMAFTKVGFAEAAKVVANVVVDHASNEYLDDRLEVQVIQLIAQDNSYLINMGFAG